MLAKHSNIGQNFIANERDERRKPPKNVLLLGSGFVSKPVIDYLSMSGNNTITVATNDMTAAKVTEGNKYCKCIKFDATNKNKLIN